MYWVINGCSFAEMNRNTRVAWTSKQMSQPTKANPNHGQGCIQPMKVITKKRRRVPVSCKKDFSISVDKIIKSIHLPAEAVVTIRKPYPWNTL